MIVSSRLSLVGQCDLECAAVAQECPDDVDQAAGERDQWLGVDLSFTTFALVEATRGNIGPFDARQCGQVEHSPQPAVVALRAVQIASHPAGIAGYRCEAGVGGQAAGVAEGGEQVAAGVGQQLGPRNGPKPSILVIRSASRWAWKRSGSCSSRPLISRPRPNSWQASRAISGTRIVSTDRETVYSPAAAQGLSMMDGTVRLCA